MPKKTKSKKNVEAKLKPIQKLTLFFFERASLTAFIWFAVTIFGIASYTTLLKREGFPSVNTPFSIAQGTYLVNDAAKVDKQVAEPLNKFLTEQDGVKQVLTQSYDNFFITTVAYEDSINAEDKSRELNQQISDQKLLPTQAVANFEPFKFGFTPRGDDVVISFYSQNDTKTSQLTEKAKAAAEFIKSKNIKSIQSVSVINPFESAVNPATGKTEVTQKSFDIFGQRQDSNTKFHNSVAIGVDAREGTDNLKLDDELSAALSELNQNPEFAGYNATISASYGPQINEQISELQKVLLEGLLAVLIVGSIVIAVRASLITVLSMLTVLATTVGLLYLIGYTLNTITLFALILGLALIVDDTIIMIEAIDAQRKKFRDRRKIVTVATGKISRAMIAATLTAALSFVPLIFVGGILGKFIRAIPITIISALGISLLVALVVIPFLARFLLLGKKQVGEGNVKEIAAGVEARIARAISAPMLWAKGSSKKLLSVGFVAVFIGLIFIGTGSWLFQKVTFNIFPPTKDSNQLTLSITFPPNTSIERAQKITAEADKITANVVGVHFQKASYYGQANVQSALAYIDITPYDERDIRSPQIADQIDAKFVNFKEAKVKAGQADVGPPAASFSARIDSSQDRPAAIKLAGDIAKYLQKTELKRLDGSTAELESVEVTNTSIYNRDNGNQYVEVGAKFVDDDTSTLVTLAKDAVESEFPPDRVASYELSDNALSFNFGQEDENQDSFKTLALAFPILLLVIYIFLASQFKSMLQPLLIFMAIPFSILGITLGLYLTDNAFSFFTMMGFFALIGLSIKNTILLTDYANQSRRAGMGPVDAAHEALAERFRPLIATSLTAVFSLIPLTLTSPFWEGLGVVLIFGLLSSTLLVITVFPYYYLGSEFLRARYNRKTGILWTILTITLLLALYKLAAPVAILAPVLAALILAAPKRLARS